MIVKEISLLILIIFVFGASGCTIVKNDSLDLPKQTPTPTPEKKISPEEDRDNHRISDIINLSTALERYANSNGGQYPKTEGAEKISDETSNVFKAMYDGGFLFKPIKDPLPDKYDYGYKSDGQAYEITAVLEDKDGGRCEMAGNYCIYKFGKGEVGSLSTPETKSIKE